MSSFVCHHCIMRHPLSPSVSLDISVSYLSLSLSVSLVMSKTHVFATFLLQHITDIFHIEQSRVELVTYRYMFYAVCAFPLLVRHHTTRFVPKDRERISTYRSLIHEGLRQMRNHIGPVCFIPSPTFLRSRVSFYRTYSVNFVNAQIKHAMRSKSATWTNKHRRGADIYSGPSMITWHDASTSAVSGFRSEARRAPVS